MMSQQDEEDSILQGIDRTRELWSSKADGDISYLTPKSVVDMRKHSKPTENGLNGHSVPEDVVRFEDKVEDEYDLPDVKSIKSRWEHKPKSEEHTHKKPPKHKTALDRNQPTPVPVNREENREEKEEEYEVGMKQLKEHFEMEAKRSTSVEVKNRNKPVTRDTINKRVSVKRKHEKNHASVNGTSTTTTTTNKRFEEEIKIANSYEVSHEKDDLPKVELSTLKYRFENNKDEKIITPETTGVPKRKVRQVSMSSDTSSVVATEIVRSEDKVEDKIEVEVNSLRQKFEQKMKQQTTYTYTSKPVEIERKTRKSTSSESSNDAVPMSADIVRSSEVVYDEMVGEESVKDRLARYKEMANKPTEIKHKVSIKRKISTPPKKEKVEEEKVSSIETEIVRSPPAGTKERPDYTASVDLHEAKALFEDKSSPRSGSRNSSSNNRSPSRSYSSRSSTSSPSPSRSGASSRNSSRQEVVVLEQNEVKRVSTTSESEDMDVVRPQPAGSKEVADYSPSVDLRSVRSMFENPQSPPKKERPAPVKRPIVVERKRSDSSSPERNPEIVRSSTAGQKEVIDCEFSKDKLNQVKSMFSSDVSKPSENKQKTEVKQETFVEEVDKEIVRSSVAKEEPSYELSIDLSATRNMFDSPRRPEQYEPRNTITRTESQKKKEAAEIVHTSEAGVKEVPEYKLDLKTKKQLFEDGIKEQSDSSSSSDSESEAEDLVKSSKAGKREVVDVKPTADIKNVTKMFESNDVRNEDEVEEEAEEVEKLEENDGLSSSSSSDTESEGEVQLQPEIVEDNYIKEEGDQNEVEEITNEYKHEEEALKEAPNARTESLSSESTQSEAEDIEDSHPEVQDKQQAEEEGDKILVQDNIDQEPAAAVVPVRVAITEPLADTTADVEQDSHSEPEQLEQPQQLEDDQPHERASDKVYSSSSDEEEEQQEDAGDLSSPSSTDEKARKSVSSSSDEENSYLN